MTEFNEKDIPTEIIVHQGSRVIELGWADGFRSRLSFEFLRTHSPSAEVRGHAPGQEILQVGKRDVGLRGVEPVGHYGIRPEFDDGHDSGIFSWDYLRWLAMNEETLWRTYLEKLAAAGASRDFES